MPSSKILAAAATLVALSSAACASAKPIVYSAPPAELTGPTNPYVAAGLQVEGQADRHVIVISIDGLRPDAIDHFGARTLQRLIAEGSYSLEAQTITPSITLPSHTSMLTGTEPEVHGITWNNNQVETRGRVTVPTIFRAARDRGLKVAAFASKGKFNHLFAPADLDYFVVPTGNSSWSAGRTAKEVARYLDGNEPNLLFVHLREPDHYGHIFGWMGRVYGWAVRRADDAVEEVLESADRTFGEGNYTVIVTADHGGNGHHHGDSTTSDKTIPWIAWGKGVAAAELPAGIYTTDTAATALWLLGITAPPSVVGTPVEKAFDAGVLVRQFGTPAPFGAQHERGVAAANQP